MVSPNLRINTVIITLIAIILVLLLTSSEAETRENMSILYTESQLSTKSLAVDLLKKEEGFRSKPYLGPEGYLHIGYGQKLSNEKNLDPTEWNIYTTKEHAGWILSNRVDAIIYLLEGSKHKHAYLKLTPERQAIVVSMAFQMGVSGTMLFKDMWKYLYLDEYERAGWAMLESKWYQQTPYRATRHAKTMMTGELPNEW